MAQAVSTEAEDLLSYSIGVIRDGQIIGGVLRGWNVSSEVTISKAVAEGMQAGMNQNIYDTSTAGHPDFRFVDLTDGDAYVFGLSCNHDGQVTSVIVVYLAHGTNYHLAFLTDPAV